MPAFDNPERIALLSLHSSPLAQLGGADAGGMNLYVRKLAEGLATRGVEVDVFTRRTSPRDHIVELAPGARLIPVQGGPAKDLPKSVLPLHLVQMVDAIRRFAEHENAAYDLFHSHYWLSGLAAHELRTDPSIPIVHMFHTLARLKEFHFGQPDPSDTVARFDGERTVMECADVVVGATPGERELMERLYRRELRSYMVVPPGVDSDLFRPLDRDTCRRQLRIESEYVVLFVGRPDRIKGFDVVLSALAEAKLQLSASITLVKVGGKAASGQAVQRRQLEQIRRLGLEKNVDFRGLVPQDDLPAYYSAADVCAVPSAYETFGTVAIEAMACQTPPVAFGVGGLLATVRDGQTGFLAKPHDPRDFADVLIRALRSGDREAIGRRARMSVQRFTWDSTVDKTLAAYRLAQFVRRNDVRHACARC